MNRSFWDTFRRGALIPLALAIAPLCAATAADERQSVEELRNTVINLLQALVDQGVISKEKAAQLVKQAQDKAAASAAALAKSEEGAVRVPYVPQIVKDEISKQVAAELKPAVVAEVVKEAKDQGWGVPGALPDWIKQGRFSGTVMLREEAILYGRDNTPNSYLNFNAVNAAGGTNKAGINAFLDTTVDRFRFRGAARLAFETSFSDSLSAGMRLSTGNTSDLVSPSQTLDGTAPYSFGLDNLFIRLDERTARQFPWLSVVGGKFTSPWFTLTDLVFHKQLNFNGLAATGRLGFGDGSADQSHAFLTIGAMPTQEVALSARDKWLYGAQLGTQLHFANQQRLRFGVAYFDFANAEGRLNAPFLNSTDYTAPQFFRTGNTLVDIRNDNDPATNLYALASKFRLFNVSATYEIPVGRYTFQLTADAVKNIGFKQAEILARTAHDVAPRTKGYQGEISFGSPAVLTAGSWRGLVGYRYLQRDAVIDALTDSDFHFGGTDATGYYVIGDYGVATRVWVRFRYQSSNTIDSIIPFGVDTMQLDLNTRF